MPKWVAAVLIGVLGAGLVSGCSSDDGSKTAPWAREVVTGRQMWTTTKDGWTVTAYEMGTDAAPRDSDVLDDATNRPLVRAGDAIVFVNLVATNTSDSTRFVGIDEPRMWAMPINSPYSQGVQDVTPASDQQMSDHNVWYHSPKLHADDHHPFTVAPGKSFAMGFVLPVALGKDWVFVPSLFVYESKDASGSNLTFDMQPFTFE